MNDGSLRDSPHPSMSRAPGPLADPGALNSWGFSAPFEKGQQDPLHAPSPGAAAGPGPYTPSGGWWVQIAHHPGRAKDLASCLLLLLLVALFPWQLTFQRWLPSSIDFVLQYYPNLAFLGRSLKAGEIPLWNPHVFSGTPYLADPQSGALYLPNWPFLLAMDTPDAARAIVLLHLALAAVGAYLYLRTIGLGSAPAMIGAISFGVSEYTVTQVAGIPLLINLAWIPMVLLLAERTLQRHSVGYAMATSVALTLQLFNGWPHGLYLTALALLATFLWHLVVDLLATHSWKGPIRSTWLMALVGLMWALLGSVLLLPALEFASLSSYLMDRGLDQAGGEGYVTVLAVLGVGGSEGHGAYLGGMGLLLLLLGSLYGQDRKRVWLYLSLGTFALLAAFGTKAPLYAVLYQWVPGFKAFHTPGRFMVLYLLSASALIAMGTEVVIKGIDRRRWLVAAGVAVLLVVPFYHTMSRMFAPEAFQLLLTNLFSWYSGPYLRPDEARHLLFSGAAAVAIFLMIPFGRPRGAVRYWAILGIMVADLFLYRGLGGHYFAAPPELFKPAEALLNQAGDSESMARYRVMGYARNGTMHFLSDFPSNLVSDLEPPNLSMLYDTEDVQGYNPLQLRRYAQYLAAINGGPDDYHWALVYNLQSPLLDLLNLRYLLLRGSDYRLSDVTIATGLNLESSGESVSIRPKPMEASGLRVYSYLGNATALRDGDVAARLVVTDTSGSSLSFDLRAGIETAEWAYDRPDVLSRVQHHRASIAVTWNLPSPVHTYVDEIRFPRTITIGQVTLQRARPDVFIAIPELAAVPTRPTGRYQLVAQAGGTRLYRNNLALPRALLVPKAEVLQDPAELLSRLQEDGFDPRKEVLLEGPGLPREQGDGSSEGEVVEISHSDNTVRLQVRATSYGFLLLNELSYPGWNGYVDGQRTRVWRANYLFRAIEVPPGEHEVEFRFEPDSLKLGLAFSLSALALLMAATIYHLKARHRRKEEAPG